MSQWTHMVGVIQCSWTKEEAEKLLGKPVLWDDHYKLGLKYGTPEYKDYMDNVWGKAFTDWEDGHGIPMGSEGSVDWYFTKTVDENCIGMGSIIAIQGDLRDFGGTYDIEQTIQWFVNAAKEARFASLVIKDEWSDEYIYIVADWGHIMISKGKENNQL